VWPSGIACPFCGIDVRIIDTRSLMAFEGTAGHDRGPPIVWLCWANGSSGRPHRTGPQSASLPPLGLVSYLVVSIPSMSRAEVDQGLQVRHHPPPARQQRRSMPGIGRWLSDSGEKQNKSAGPSPMTSHGRAITMRRQGHRMQETYAHTRQLP
jgi:hypothetical protein